MVLVALPVLGGVVQHRSEGWYPESDDATIVLLAGDTFSADPPLVGMISTGGASLSDPELHHPGPLELYLLAPLTHLGLGPAAGAVVTAALVSLASIAAMVAGLAALGGRRLAAAGTVAAALLLWGMGGDAPVSVWNPYVVALPFACFLVHAALASAGRSWALVGVVAFGSFVAQTHLSYAGLVGLVVAWVVVVTAWRSFRRRPSDLRPHVTAVATGAVLWLPPVIDQLRGDPGNLGQIWRSFTGEGGATVGASALGELGRVVGLPVLGLRPRGEIVRVLADLDVVAAALVAVPWLALALAGTLAWRRRCGAEVAVLGTLGVALVAGMLTATRIPLSDGITYQYYALWMWPLAAVLWLLVAWVAWRLLPDGVTRRASTVLPGAVGPVAVAVVVALVAVLPRPGAWAPWASYRRIAGDVVPGTVAALPQDRTYLVRFRGATPYLSTGSAVVLGLAHQGSEVFVDPGAPTPVFPWGEARRHDGEPVDAEVWVVGGQHPPDLPDRARLVAETVTLTAADRRDLADATERVTARVAAVGARPGPRTAATADDERRLAAALAAPEPALANGELAALGSRGLLSVPGLEADDLFTLQRLESLAEEGRVAVYVVGADAP